MRKELLKLMCCPNDGADLKLFILSGENNRITKGLLICLECNDAWVVVQGIPRFISASSVDLNLEHEFLVENRFEIDSEFPGLVQSMKQKLSAFEEEAKGRNYDWNEDELLFWEENYKNRFHNDEKNRTTYNRLLPRQKFILDPLKKENISAILEVGCGTCGTLYHSHFSVQDKLYVGTDISFNALRVARKFLDANLVMCDAMNLPFKDESFDLILSFGLMHHLEQKDQSLEYFFKKVKTGGYIGLTEKLKSKLDFEKSRFIGKLKAKMNEKERGHGEEEYIDEEAAISIALRYGTIICQRSEYSAVRDLFTQVFVDKLHINSKLLTKMIMATDYLIIDFLGWMTPLLKGHSLILLTRRDN